MLCFLHPFTLTRVGDDEYDDKNDEQQESKSHVPLHLQDSVRQREAVLGSGKKKRGRPRKSLQPRSVKKQSRRLRARQVQDVPAQSLPLPVREEMTLTSGPQVSRHQMEETIKYRLFGSVDEMKDSLFMQLPIRDEDEVEDDQAREIRDKHIAKLNKDFPREGRIWRALSILPFEMYGWKKDENYDDDDIRNQFQFIQNKWYVSQDGMVALFQKIESEPTLSGTRPQLVDGYVRHRFINTWAKDNDGVINKDMVIPLSYMILFTFCKVPDFNRDDGWVIDHTDGIKDNNMLYNLWPFPVEGINKRVRDKLNRNNSSGNNGVSPEVVIRGEDCFLVDVPGTKEKVKCDSQRDGISTRFGLEDDASWFQHMNPNHTMMMLFFRDDHLSLTIRKWGDTFLKPEDRDYSDFMINPMDDILGGDFDPESSEENKTQKTLRDLLVLESNEVVIDDYIGSGDYSGGYFAAITSALISLGMIDDLKRLFPSELSDKDLIIMGKILHANMINHIRNHNTREMNHARNTLKEIIERDVDDTTIKFTVDGFIDSVRSDIYGRQVTNSGSIQSHVFHDMFNVSIVVWTDSIDGKTFKLIDRYTAPRGGKNVIHLHVNNDNMWRKIHIPRPNSKRVSSFYYNIEAHWLEKVNHY